jgi:DNA polymerase I
MKIIDTSKPTDYLTAVEAEWVYNGLDCCVTAEILDVLLPRLNKYTQRTYDFSRALQGPVLRMRLRGVKIDMERRKTVIAAYRDRIDQIEDDLEYIVRESTGMIGFNWRSTAHLRKLFYDIFQIPQSRLTKVGRIPVMDREALEKMDEYAIAQPFCERMTRLRELGKRLSVLEDTDDKPFVDEDGRARTSYNIAGTNSGRLSSSLSEFGTGGNLQNIEELLRTIFIADDGMKMANFDAEQGESRCVGAIEWNLFQAGAYLDACESSDLHTYIARICWPDLRWTGDWERDKELAGHKLYRHHSRRDMCKKLGHGTNYGGQPKNMSRQTKIDFEIVKAFYANYNKAFPAHAMWHRWVEEQLRSRGVIVNLTGRQRHFFGRRDDPKVLREAIAYDPQGSLADIVNGGMLRVCQAGDCELLMQNHDAIVVQYPQEREDEIIPRIKKQLENRVQLKHGRTLSIPYGCQTGWNWGKCGKDNPNGLKDYEPGDQRRRST